MGMLVLASGLLLYHPFYGISARVVLSGSMGKAAPVGSVVINHVIPEGEYRVGDVITFYAPGQAGVVTHRIARLYTGSDGVPRVDTKGDANPNGDLWSLTLGSIQGKKVLMIPGLGYLLQLVKTPMGFLIFALFSFVVLVHLELQYLLEMVRFGWRKWRA